MRKIKFAEVVFLVWIIILGVILSYMPRIEVRAEPTSKSPTNGLTPREPIYIEGNENFTSANGVISGSGTNNDPYIIEGWNISAFSVSAQWWFDCIRIKNTSRYFVIRNCVVYGSGMSEDGIYFYNVTHGTINNVTSHYNDDGIKLLFSSNNKIINCTLYKNYDDGIHLWRSSDTIITNCTIRDSWWYGIRIEVSSNIQITYSTVYNNSYPHQEYAINTFNSSVSIHYCNIYNNPGYGVYNSNAETQYQVNATYCWWGSANGPGGKGPGRGDKVSNNVLYDPWLTKPWQEGIEIGTQPEKEKGVEEGLNTIYFVTIGIVVAVGIIIAVFFLRKRVIVPKPEVMPPKPELIPPEVLTVTLRCPQCKTTFRVESKEKPFKVKCPSCGAEGVIR
ncbi:MAG: right-handed parallel beta-helix repeat-containing protein [Candidatus Thermoplasmatota archaeon]